MTEEELTQIINTIEYAFNCMEQLITLPDAVKKTLKDNESNAHLSDDMLKIIQYILYDLNREKPALDNRPWFDTPWNEAYCRKKWEEERKRAKAEAKADISLSPSP